MASLMTIFRQIEREGARWGLFPVLERDRVRVCEKVKELVTHGPRGLTSTRDAFRTVCSLNEQSGFDSFNSILAQRLKREHHDFMKMVITRERRIKAQKQAEIDLRLKDLGNKMRTALSGRLIFT